MLSFTTKGGATASGLLAVSLCAITREPPMDRRNKHCQRHEHDAHAKQEDRCGEALQARCAGKHGGPGGGSCVSWQRLSARRQRGLHAQRGRVGGLETKRIGDVGWLSPGVVSAWRSSRASTRYAATLGASFKEVCASARASSGASLRSRTIAMPACAAADFGSAASALWNSCSASGSRPCAR